MPEIKVLKSDDMPWQQAIDRPKYAGRRKPLGNDRLTAGLWELPPGKKSFPLHLHHVAEEAMFVIAGRARVRTPEGEHYVGPGDYVQFPAGGPAHQLINDGPEPFTYLGISASMGFDIVEYPDSGKLACAIGAAPTGKRFIFKKAQQAEYWDGEE